MVWTCLIRDVTWTKTIRYKLAAMPMTNMANDDSRFFFFQQSALQQTQKRYRKMPDDLPESLKYARLNPKVAAYLASKEREAQKQAEQDPFGDGLGKKSLLPHINQAMTHIKNRLDSALSNDEDSQRYLFEDTKASSVDILQQLARYLYYYDDVASHIPRGLEYQLMYCWKELVSDVIFVPREWQTQEIKEQYYNSLRETQSDEESFEGELKQAAGGNVSRAENRGSDSKLKHRKGGAGNRLTIPEIIEDESKTDKPMKRSDSRMSNLSATKGRLDAKGGRSSRDHNRATSGLRSASIRKTSHDDHSSNLAETTPSDPRSTGLGNQQAINPTIQFQYSKASDSDNGWLVNKGKDDEIDRSAILNYCVELLQANMKVTKEQKIKDMENGNDKPVVIRYYGDAKREALLKYRKSPVKLHASAVYRGGKPRVPSIRMYDDKNELKQVMQATHQDGSSIIYYPSGRPAVVYSAAGFGRPGFYLLAYDDSVDGRMLVCFTPSGRGVCYSEMGNIRVLITEKGGHVAEENGSVVRKWKWPTAATMRNMSPIVFQIGNNLMFRCSGQMQISLMFNCNKEVARFSLCPTPGAVESKPGEDNEQLLTAFTFCSRAARDLNRLFAPKQKPKGKSQKKKSKGHSVEIQKLLEFNDKLEYDTEADRELARLQRKAKCLIDEWMEHYRISIGLTSPFLSAVTDQPQYTPRHRNIHSANLTASERRQTFGSETPERQRRAPSAPLFALKTAQSLPDDVDKVDELQWRKTPVQSGVKFDDNVADAGGDNVSVSPTAAAMFERLAHSAGRRSSKGSRTPVSSAPLSRQMTWAPGSEIVQLKSLCPVAIRQQMLGMERPICRCSRHFVPQIMDLEYDTFINSESPESQVIVVEVISSIFPYATTAEKMVEELYTIMNRNRTKPCVQSRGDTFRLLQYDINTAAENSDHTQPLLLTRHNVVPGMFLMYLNGKLLFCDHIFNGYGNARKDFKKQIMKTRLDAMQGYSLPQDFKFSPSRGRSGMRSAWGGEIGGTGVDNYGSTGTGITTEGTMLPAQRPFTASSASSKDNNVLDQVKEIYVRIGPLLNTHSTKKRKYENVQMISMSLSPMGYRSPGEYPRPFASTDFRRHLSAPGRRLQGTVM